MDKKNLKPQVFPTQEQKDERLAEIEKVKIFEAEKTQVTNQIYSSVKVDANLDEQSYDYVKQNDSLEVMRQRAQKELDLRNNGDIVQYPELAEKPERRKVVQDTVKKTVEEIARERTEAQIKLRDEQIIKNQEMIDNYNIQIDESTTRTNEYTKQKEDVNPIPNIPTPPVIPPVVENVSYGKTPSNINPYILELSQPNYNSPFDVIPLPSKGKLYRNKKASIRVSYMTTADENILTSPNLLASGQFLEILINRKLLEPDLRYKDLHSGDRNAIMIWLRATGYGHMYPVTLLDENKDPFDTEINLNELKTKNLGVDPDIDGEFYFKFPLSKVQIKFKLLTCGDIDAVESMVEEDTAKKIPVNNENTYMLERMIVEVNGERDKNIIKDFVNTIRIQDGKDFNEYLTKIESGIDLNLDIKTPGGGSIATFLPLNFNFFWPNYGL